MSATTEKLERLELSLNHRGEIPMQSFPNPANKNKILRPSLGDMQKERRRPSHLPFPHQSHSLSSINRIDEETAIKLKKIMKLNGLLTINGTEYKAEIKDLEDLGELGNGTSGHVVKMRHKESDTVLAVKQMRRTGNEEENKRIIMDLDVVLKSHDCEYIVQCLGCFINESDVWICMELMAMCFDKLQKKSKFPVPENILGKVTVATVKALAYLKDVHGVIHRDVKPSNILIDERGNIKLCDFGISGRLVDSKAKTRSAGCAAYMAPERIEPDPRKPEYDIRADVWSLGITLVELATGKFPYSNCATDFEVLTKVLESAPPCLPHDQGFSLEFQNFVEKCLTKNYHKRPKYPELLEQPFIKKYEVEPVDVGIWFASVMEKTGLRSHRRVSPSPVAAEQNRPKFLQSNLSNYFKSYTSSNSSAASSPNTNCSNSIVKTPSPLSNQSLLASLTNATKSKLNGHQKLPPPQPTTPTSSLLSSSTTSLHNHKNTHTRPLVLNKPSNMMSKSDLTDYGFGEPSAFHNPYYNRHYLKVEEFNDVNNEESTNIVTEMNKMYIHSPFTQRKPEILNGNRRSINSSSPKKESTFSQIGQSIIRNLTNSPFIGRKNSNGGSQQPSSLPILQSERERTQRPQFHPTNNDGFFNYAHYHHPNDGGGDSNAAGPYGGQELRQLQCSPSPLTGRKRIQPSSSSIKTQYGNTSPIVLQRFYHQQNQHLERQQEEIEEEEQQHQQSLSSTNPFHNNYFHKTTTKTTTSSNNTRYNSSPLPSPSLGRKSQIPKYKYHNNANDRVYQFYDGGGEGMASGFNEPPSELQSAIIYEKKNENMIESYNNAKIKNSQRDEDELKNLDSDKFKDGHGWFRSIAGVVKKRFASYVKLHLNPKESEINERDKFFNPAHNSSHGGRTVGISTNPFLNSPTSASSSTTSNIPAPQQYHHHQPATPLSSPHVLSGLDRRHRSPDPPPRYNRQSPLMIRRNLIEYGQIPPDSPLLSRRIITSLSSSSPPPTNNFSRRGCDSLPGSPQNYQTHMIYTPEPHRRYYRTIDQ